ncbi:MAG: MraY family glycosyltransferase [Acidobacteriota bacterium]|nr:MraY family glycosyltransferase [Acidobacteriota bacterium]
MSRWGLYLVTFVLAGGLSIWLTPRMREAALRFGIVDRPDGRLKLHREPIPYLGGLAIYLSFLVAVAMTFRFGEEVLGLLLAGSIVVIVGLIDDLGELGPTTKLVGQMIAVLVLIKSGIYIQLAFLPPVVTIPLSVLWLVAVTNAFNLIDVMDGLSAGTGAVAALALFAVAEWNSDVTAAVLLVALAGSCLGFVRYNFEPARIYMGDTGSLFLGLMLGALAMNNAYTERNSISALAPALILGVPLFDMVFVMYVRWRRGLPVMLGSPDHVALRLRKWRLSVQQTVGLSYAVTASLGAAAVGMMLLDQQGAMMVLGGLVLVALVAVFLLRKINMSL